MWPGCLAGRRREGLGWGRTVSSGLGSLPLLPPSQESLLGSSPHLCRHSLHKAQAEPRLEGRETCLGGKGRKAEAGGHPSAGGVQG